MQIKTPKDLDLQILTIRTNGAIPLLLMDNTPLKAECSISLSAPLFNAVTPDCS
jgi:hypothetical protein